MRSVRTHTSGTVSICRGAPAAAVLIAGLAATAQSQTIGESQPELESSPTRRIEVSVSGGGLSGGPNRRLEAAMRTAGLDDSSPGILGSPVAHPYSRSGGGSSFDASVRMRGPWFVGLTYSRTSTGSSSGYRVLPGILRRDSIHLSHGVRSLAAVVGLRLGALSVAAGPARHVTSMTTDRASLGFVAQARIAYPQGSRAFMTIKSEYRSVQTADVGPYVSGESGAYPAFEGRVPMSHVYFGAGLGVRF